ncbi:hypothetical protein MJC1_01288 [Methylocystis sp. MJC1]|nr:hypothetical protein MJC1_01288 [Methylocystis sp. MJC1]
MFSMSICGRGATGRITRFFACGVFLASLARPANAGFLEELFGLGDAYQARSAPRTQAHVKHIYARRHSFSLRFDNLQKRNARARERQILENGSDLAEAKLPKPFFCLAEPAQPQAEDNSFLLLHDATLRTGDGIVTPTGILVFRGRVGCPHSNADFVALADSGLPRQKRDALLSLERTLPSHRPGAGARAGKPSEVKMAGEGHP